MGNVFKTSRDIHVTYDLKGSRAGRITKVDKDQPHNPGVTLKDLNFLENKIKIKVLP